jgi:prephenate dehydrogenase
MFAPSLGLGGRPVAAVRISDGPRTAAMLQLITESGGRIVEMSATEHDRICAITQAMTHAAVLAFGIALSEADLDLDTVVAVAPPPHASLLALLARLCAGAPETYWDVQVANPAAGLARASLRRALSRLDELVDDANEAGFGQLLDEARNTLGEHFPRYRDACARMFDTAIPR